MKVTQDMVGVEVQVECGGCDGTGYHMAWANHRPVGKVHCYQCGGTDGDRWRHTDGTVTGTPGTPGDGYYHYPIPQWMVGKDMNRHYSLRTWA